MHRRFALLAAMLFLFAADVNAQGPGTAETVKQAGPLPSLAPIVKQLRPTVVNVASRFKPRRVARLQRPPRGQQRQNPFEQGPGDGVWQPRPGQVGQPD